jgi:putative ABC transport system substrate-binding protein
MMSGNEPLRNRSRKRRILLTGIVIAGLLLAGCGGTKGPEIYTIGLLNNSQGQAPYIEGFKAGMTELGYIEGQNVVYLYNGPTGTLDAVKPEAEKLKAQNLDLLLAVGTATTQVAKGVFSDTAVPIVFVPAFYPDKEGLVDSFARPGGNLTGVNNTDTLGKALEWLLKVAPDVKRVYVPHNPNDQSAIMSLQSLSEAAKILNLELVVANGTIAEELGPITKNIPDNVDAVFVERSGSVTGLLKNIVEAATARGIPVVTSNVGAHIDMGVLLAYGPSQRGGPGHPASRKRGSVSWHQSQNRPDHWHQCAG